MVSVADLKLFGQDGDLSAWIGLVPKQSPSGGNEVLGMPPADMLREAKSVHDYWSRIIPMGYGSSGTGGPHHLAMELFKLAAG
jgi:hypothetical protein